MRSRSSKIGLSAAFCAVTVIAGAGLVGHSARADEALTDPFLGQHDAIEAGRDVYRSKCLVCHGSSGARGPDLFATKLSDERFLETVINGRKGTLMPAFGTRLSPDEVWQVHAFIKSTDHY